MRVFWRFDDELESIPYIQPHEAVPTTIIVKIAGTREVAVAVRHRPDVAVDGVAAPALVAVLEACEAVTFDLAGSKALLDGSAAGVPVHSVVVQCSDVVLCVTVSCYQ